MRSSVVMLFMLLSPSVFAAEDCGFTLDFARDYAERNLREQGQDPAQFFAAHPNHAEETRRNLCALLTFATEMAKESHPIGSLDPTIQTWFGEMVIDTRDAPGGAPSPWFEYRY